jgi:MFS transporter, MHS family, proline/betaine transporter
MINSKGLRRTTLATFIGTILEHQDFIIFGHLLPLIVPLCFPYEDLSSARMRGIFGFALGYLFRPLGGLAFGHFGDKFGRKKPMVFSILLMSVPTLMLAFLPSYAQIGAASGFILYLCRSVQSVSVGGEFSASGTIIIENAPLNRKNLFSSISAVAVFSGAILGAVSGWFFTQPFMPSWGWRICFLIGSLIAITGFYMRRKAIETPEFELVIKHNKILKSPVIDTLKKDWRSHICWIGITYVGIYVYMVVYVPTIMKSNFGYSISESLLVTICFMSLVLLFLPVFGLLADKIGTKKVMSSGVVLVGVIMPISLGGLKFDTPFYFFLFYGLACVAFAAQAAPMTRVAQYMYPTERRYSGSSFGLGLGTAIIGGIGPIVLTILKEKTNNIYGPSIYIIFLQFFALLSLYFAPSFLKKPD